ncbi:Lrp/AsnC family transcriptional regulator [Demequina zhanjiangensis]|uniref:Lrp/AsnC family transcriptional regulator n=1 Tax=Demequina zhanjiangensis TaxID=3051659 RepID=A0ABT8G1I6_9MICO|nr:Lrp/AsnC family transcriptional regulator [Demequina sp. SYSU T00b26]MDN4472579.1 Lrp/AsnC family transcriptional regulator [Demequina sp. SYSU T00b26]
MDAIDREILAIVQSEGRISATELAQRIGLSLTPCHRRLRALEDSGVIRGYRAEVDPHQVDLTFATVVSVTLQNVAPGDFLDFEQAVVDLPEVVQAQRLFGNPDYMLQVVCRDLKAFQELFDTRLSALPGVQRLESTLVMKDIVPHRGLPI